MKRFIFIFSFILLTISCNISRNQSYIDEDVGLSEMDSIEVNLYYHTDRKVDNWENKTFKISIEETKDNLESQNIQIDSLFSDEFDLSRFLWYGFEELRKDCEYPDTFIPKDIVLSILDTIKILDHKEYEAYPYELSIFGLCKNRFGNIIECQKIINPDTRTEEINEINHKYHYYVHDFKKYVDPAFLIKKRYYSKILKRTKFITSWDTIIRYEESLVYTEDFKPEYFTYVPFSYNDVGYYLIIVNED